MNNDPFTVRTVAIGLLTIAVLVVIGGIVLAFNNKHLSDALIAMGSGALGGLSTFLVSSRINQVQVSSNTPADTADPTVSTDT